MQFDEVYKRIKKSKALEDPKNVKTLQKIMAQLEQLANHEQVVAIGETGLDYFRDQSSETKKQQTEIFKKHIELAVKVSKPLMLHVRASKGTDDAYYDALEILKEAQHKHTSMLKAVTERNTLVLVKDFCSDPRSNTNSCHQKASLHHQVHLRAL